MQIRIRRCAVLAVVALSAAAVLVTPLSVTTPATVAVAPAAAGPAAAGNSVVERPDVVYGSARTKSGDRLQLRLDLWLPTDVGGRRPAVLLAHGGGFHSGTRKNRRIRWMAQALARRGFVTASVSYRLRDTRWVRQAKGLQLIRSGAARRAQHDLQAAVRYLRRNARPLAVDRRRIAVLGSSAGAIAALRVAFNPEDPGHSGNPGYRSAVSAAVSLWGAGDPQMIERGAPPAMMFHGRKDRAMPFWLARKTCAATRNKGNVCRTRWWWGERHSPWHRKHEIRRKTKRFLRWNM